MRNFILAVLFLLTSCAEDQGEEKPQIEFQFQLIDEDGNVATKFEEGENFIFSFTIVNETNETIYLKQNSLNRANFMQIFKIEGRDAIEMGKPYKGLFCLEVGAIPILEGVNEFTIPWKAPLNYYPEEGLFFCYGNDKDLLTKGSIVLNLQAHSPFPQVMTLSLPILCISKSTLKLCNQNHKKLPLFAQFIITHLLTIHHKGLGAQRIKLKVQK